MSTINLYNVDCEEFMRGVPNKHYDLAIVDPPYGLGDTTTSKGNKRRDPLHKRVKWNDSIPSADYFFQLRRVSKHQIIWGCNYFFPYISEAGRVVHYKAPFQDTESGKINFCPADLASQTFDSRIEFFSYNWYGNSQGGKPNFKNEGIDARIHPTQKPVALYKWLLSKYALPGQKILDTHGGSMSSAIACYDMGFDLDLCENDDDHFSAGKDRVERHMAQGRLFEPVGA